MHEDALLLSIQDGTIEQFENVDVVRSVSRNRDVVDFGCGGAGFGPDTTYVGFFYSADHDLAGAWCGPSDASQLQPSGKGFEWRQPDGDNRYYVEHICGEFYYYKASF